MPPKRRRSAAAPPPPQPSPLSQKIEFRATEDDAWYAVWLQLQPPETLRVMYAEFNAACDETFAAGQFETPAAVEAFRARFRPVSVPLQDECCREVVKGTRVCACRRIGDDVRYYDAIVDSVKYSHVEGKYPCACTFEIIWQHGQQTTEKTSTDIGNICLVQSTGKQMDPILENFLEIARRRFKARNSEQGPCPESFRHEVESVRCDLASSNINVSACSSDNIYFSVDYDESKKSQFSVCSLKETTPKGAVKSTFHGKMHKKIEPDLDLGSSPEWKNFPRKSYYFFRINNLEKDLSPFCIVDFIREKTSVSSVVIILPALSSESCSTGTIFIETKEKAEKLSEFLFNPGHIIMSVRGRPWVVYKKWHGPVEGKMPIYEEQSVHRNGGHLSKIKLVHVGTAEYNTGKKLLEIHREFHDHIELLHGTLEREERSIRL